MSHWTSTQLTCLEALGVPLYTFTGTQPIPLAGADKSLTPEQSIEPVEASPIPANSRYLYKLGPWVLEFNQRLPVQGYTWLNDLAKYCQAQPAEVSGAEHTVNVNAYARDYLQPEEKKALWAQLKSVL